MAQGKMKVKSKLPPNTKSKKGNTKGTATTKRANRPEKAKKKKLEDAHRLKQLITKTVNKTMEDEIRAMASKKSKSNLSKAQQAVAEHHKKPTTS